MNVFFDISFFFFLGKSNDLPIVPTFSPNVFVPFPLPQSPANIVPSPSMPIPRLMA